LFIWREALFVFTIIKVDIMSEDFFNLEKKPGKKKDIVFPILVLLLILVLVFGFVALREYKAKEILSTASEKLLAEIGEVIPLEDEEEPEEVVVTEEEETENGWTLVEEGTEEEREPDGYYTEEAQKGDGLTHLARRALTSHMQEEEIELSDEERVYVEDYVQKRLTPEDETTRMLDFGEEIEISEELLEEGVQEAEDLTPEDINNLSNYAAVVSF